MQQHAGSFIAHTEASTGSELPGFIKDEFDEFLECGMLAHGFLRLRCGACGHDKLLAFSCKRRGFCPSCGARRMSQTAAPARAPMIKRRHRSNQIVPPVGGSAVKATSSFDLLLIRTLGTAFYWQRIIDTGEVANASELARNPKLEVGWVCEVLRMTRLAPDIIRAILDGRQPRHLNLHAMRGRQGEVPLDWSEQRGMFGVAAGGGQTKAHSATK